jgi:hypothetical protein
VPAPARLRQVRVFGAPLGAEYVWRDLSYDGDMNGAGHAFAGIDRRS